MKSLKFNFSHPFKGHVFLRCVSNGKAAIKQILFDSKGENNFEIPLEECEDGKYKMILDWEFEERYFTHQTEFLVDQQQIVLYPS